MSLETQLVDLANQIGTDISTLQSALNIAQSNLQELQAKVDTGGAGGVSIEDLTTILQAGFGNPERNLVEVYTNAVTSVLMGGIS